MVKRPFRGPSVIWGPHSGATRGQLWSSRLHKEPHAPLLQGSRGHRHDPRPPLCPSPLSALLAWSCQPGECEPTPAVSSGFKSLFLEPGNLSALAISLPLSGRTSLVAPWLLLPTCPTPPLHLPQMLRAGPGAPSVLPASPSRRCLWSPA